jgi:hypothetical protein
LLLGALTVLLALNFYDWPLNRDVTTYATIAREIGLGKSLYLDFFDIKPPAIFFTYMLVQFFIESKPLQIFVLQIVPLLTVLVALLKCGIRAGFGMGAALWAGLVWIALSGDLRLQMQWPNTELFINALVMLAMLLFLTLDARQRSGVALAIGLLFALACLFKTVVIAMAVLMGLVHLLFPPAGSNRGITFRETLLMAASGGGTIGLVVAYFTVTGRFQVFKEAMVDFSTMYAGDIPRNIADGLTLSPFTGDNLLLRVAVATLPWMVLLSIALIDRDRRRSWLLLGAYGFSALVAVSLPGRFYAHYFQLLVPPLCLGIGWFAGLLARKSAIPKKALALLFGLPLLVLAVGESKTYFLPAETLLRGKYAEIYLETQALGRRLGNALHENEVLYQWGEESGLYWFSGKRPPASVVTFPLFMGPQAPRLIRQTKTSLQSRPPDLIVVANYSANSSIEHPVYRWILSEYRAVSPALPGEQKFFTFYVPFDANAEFVERVLMGGR